MFEYVRFGVFLVVVVVRAVVVVLVVELVTWLLSLFSVLCFQTLMATLPTSLEINIVSQCESYVSTIQRKIHSGMEDMILSLSIYLHPR